MSENFFDDIEFMEQFEEYEKRMDALAITQNKTIQEVAAAERQKTLGKIDTLLGEVMRNAEKRFPCEILGINSYIDVRIDISNEFASELGFAA